MASATTIFGIQLGLPEQRDEWMFIKILILALLSLEPKTGYQLSKDVQGSTGFFWKATHQQIYRDLASLEELGWLKFPEVTQKEKPDKKIYSITKTGKKELVRWMKEPSETPVMRDPFSLNSLWDT